MTRKELQAIKKPRTGMQAGAHVHADGWADIHLTMVVKADAVKRPRDVMAAFQAYFAKPVKPQKVTSTIGSLITVQQYWAMTPEQQGYVVYMQADIPGSPLKGKKNPYKRGTRERSEWDTGNLTAALDAQDSEE